MTYKVVGTEIDGHFPARAVAWLKSQFVSQVGGDATLDAGPYVVNNPTGLSITMNNAAGTAKSALARFVASIGTAAPYPTNFDLDAFVEDPANRSALIRLFRSTSAKNARLSVLRGDGSATETFGFDATNGVMSLYEAGVVPASNPVSGLSLYIEGGQLKSRSASGTVVVYGSGGGNNNNDTSNLVVKDALLIDGRDHGVVGGGVAGGTMNDTAAINAGAALAASRPGSTYFLGAGIYRITGTVNLTGCNLEMSQATLLYEGTGTAVMAGNAATATIAKTLKLPTVTRPAMSWDGTSVGIVLSNLNSCEVHLSLVQRFEQGVKFQGNATGFAYNTVFLSTTAKCHRNLILDATSTGWINQNTFIGGRINQSMYDSEIAAAVTAGVTMEDDTHAGMLEIGITSGVWPTGNTFIGLSVEADTPSYYRLKCYGAFNKFINCRWELHGDSADPKTPATTQSRVFWGPVARYNEILGGYDASAIVETFSAGSLGNQIYGQSKAYISADNLSTAPVPAGDQTVFHTVGGWTSDSVFADYTASTGEWTPRQGRWRITATISVVTPAAGSDVQARLLAGNTRVLDYDNQVVVVGGRTWLKLSGVDTFSGTEPLELQVRQDTNSTRYLAAAVGYNHLEAEYLGG